MKKLVALIYPFSEVEKIIDYSISLAKSLELELEFIHTVEHDNMVWNQELNTYATVGIEPVILHSEILEERTRSLKDLLQARHVYLNHTAEYNLSVTGGPVSTAVDNLSARADVEMVLIPNTNEDLKSFSIADLADKIDKPVLAFPLNTAYRGIKTIVYATDFNEHDIETLKELAMVAKRLEASITLCHIIKSEDYDVELKMSGFQELLRRKIDFVPIQILEEQAKNVSKGIKQFSKKYHADLIVLLKEDKNFLQSIFGHSTTKAMLKDIDIPILIYQE